MTLNTTMTPVMGKSEIRILPAHRPCNFLQKNWQRYYGWLMTMAEPTERTIFHCELGQGEVREIMAASGLISLLRRSWLIAGMLFAALLATALVLLHAMASRPSASGTHHNLLVGELVAGAVLCALLTLWSVQRVWRLSPGPQAHRALASGTWQRGTHEYRLLTTGLAWHSPDGSATYVPWSALTGIRETKRLFLLLDQDGGHVRGFIPKAALADLPPDTKLGELIRERIMARAHRKPAGVAADGQATPGSLGPAGKGHPVDRPHDIVAADREQVDVSRTTRHGLDLLAGVVEHLVRAQLIPLSHPSGGRSPRQPVHEVVDADNEQVQAPGIP
jgi:hypothetical protein